MIPNFDRFSKNKYPSFDKYVSDKLISDIFQELPIDLSDRIIKKLRSESDYILTQNQFFTEIRDLLTEKVKKTFYFDDPYSVETMIGMILTKIGDEHLYVMFQYVIALLGHHY